MSPDIHGEPLAAQGAIDGRQVLAELEGIVIGSPEAVAKKVGTPFLLHRDESDAFAGPSLWRWSPCR